MDIQCLSVQFVFGNRILELLPGIGTGTLMYENTLDVVAEKGHQGPSLAGSNNKKGYSHALWILNCTLNVSR